jgi:hypothetical protein
MTLITDCCGRQSSEVMFEGDPILTDEYRERFVRAGEHGVYVKVLEVSAGGQQISPVLKIRPKGDF